MDDLPRQAAPLDGRESFLELQKLLTRLKVRKVVAKQPTKRPRSNPDAGSDSAVNPSVGTPATSTSGTGICEQGAPKPPTGRRVIASSVKSGRRQQFEVVEDFSADVELDGNQQPPASQSQPPSPAASSNSSDEPDEDGDVGAIKQFKKQRKSFLLSRSKQELLSSFQQHDLPLPTSYDRRRGEAKVGPKRKLVEAIINFEKEQLLKGGMLGE